MVDTSPPSYLDNGLSPPGTVYLWHHPFNRDVPDAMYNAVISPHAGEGFMYQFINENALFEFQYEN